VSTDPVRQLERIARFTRIGIYIGAIFAILQLFAHALLVAYAAGFDGVLDATARAETNAFLALLSFVAIIPVLAVGVPFLRWFYLAYRNLQELEHTHLRYTPGWAVWGFLIPFVNYVRPYQVMRDLWRQLDVAASNSFSTTMLPQVHESNLGRWWGAYLVFNIVGAIGEVAASNVNTFDQLFVATLFLFAGTLLLFPSIATTIGVVRATTAYETALLTELCDEGALDGTAQVNLLQERATA
jgi:hypothetical protein